MSGSTPEGSRPQRDIPNTGKTFRELDLLLDQLDLFRAPHGRGYAKILLADGSRRTYPVRSSAFRTYVAHFMFRACQRADSRIVQEFLEILDGEALYGGLQRDVSVRFAWTSGGALLDLGGGTQAVEITPTGWNLVTNPPIDFVQTAGMSLLPTPVESSYGKTKKWIDLGTEQGESSLILVYFASVAAGCPAPILRVTGAEPAALARAIRHILDPHLIPISSSPADRP